MGMISRIKQGVFHVREETKTKQPALPIAKLKVTVARRVLPKGLPCLYLTIGQGILHEKLFHCLSKNYLRKERGKLKWHFFQQQ